MAPFDESNTRPGEAHYFSLLDNASEAIISFRAGEGLILEANAQAERLLGRPRDELVSTPFVEVFAPEHHDPIAWLVAQADGAPLRLEDLSIRRPSPPALPAPAHEEGRGPLTQRDNFSTSSWQPLPDPFRVPEPSDERGEAFDNGPSGRRAARPHRDEVPVSLSCNWIHVDNGVVAQAILRDATTTRQAQRDLESYAVQLEERVAARTRELQQSEERYRALFLQEQKRAQHLSLINEVQKCALDESDLDVFPHCCVRFIQEHFRRGDASFFLVDSSQPWSSLDTTTSPASILAASTSGSPSLGEEFDLVCVAQAGGHGLSAPPGTRISSRSGLIAEAARRGEILHRVAHEGENSEYVPGVYRSTKFEVAAPIMLEGRVLGVLAVQSEEALAFDTRDEEALGTAANIIATHLHSSRLFREIGELNAFHQTLINTMLHSLMVVDGHGRLEVVNERLCTTFSMAREQILGQPMARVLGEDVMHLYGLNQAIEAVTLEGTPRQIPEVHARTPEGQAVFDLRIFRVYFRGEAKAVILAINITVRWRKAHQLQLMHEIGRFFQASLDIDRVLHTVLTCITAGSSLGFNRAFVLLRDRYWLPQAGRVKPEGERDILTGVMALGPSSHEEASRIWSELSQRNPSLQEILASASQQQRGPVSPLQHATRGLSFELDAPALQVLSSIVREGRAALVHPCDLFPLPEDRNSDECRESAQVLEDAHYETPQAREHTLILMRAARSLFTAPEMAVAPLLSKDGVIGVVLADNLYSQDIINEDDVQLLDTLAQQAGLTIDNALAYQQLQEAQLGLVDAERLAAVGNMAARVSHEIRNPLATIGGFARLILKKPGDAENVASKVGIIVNEVTRLEELLGDLLDMARPRELNLEPHNVNEVVSHALLLADADIKAAGVTLKKRLAPEMPSLLMDRSRLLQAVLNIVRNGAQAMADKSGGGGNNEGESVTMTVSTRLDTEREPPMIEIGVQDEGVGISERSVKKIFNPFFSTKVSGSGLGLAVTRRILQDHGGEIEVQSQENVGTTFYLRIPARTPGSAQPAEATSEQSSQGE